MAEVGISVAAKVAEYFVDPTIRQLEYLFCVGKITRNFEIKREELILKKGRLQERIEEAINRTERIDDEVNNWKNKVESLIEELENVAQELRANNGCFRRWCPTWRRYCLCRKLEKTTQRMTELSANSDHFNPFSHSVIVPDIVYHSSKDFVLFESTKMARDQLWKALQDDGSFIIGLWGMGGSGKTTLVKEVGKKAKESKLFDRVVFASVSQTLDIRKIQGEIADLLGLKLEEESETGRARRIALRLQSSVERILMILDDVWTKLNLEDIGDPFGGNHQRSCKVLLTTRRLDVCTLMDCQKKIPLHLLTEGEAWTLFQTHANVDVCAREVAQEIAKECRGLPIAIVTVGTCLKGKGQDEMNVVLHKLKHAKPLSVDEGVRDAFACLELSYNYLRSSEAKLLLLLCSMFPEDHQINIEDIFRYGVGLDLCKDADSFEIARSQIATAINILIDSSLLMYSVNFKKQKCVAIHDMVRDVALWIASKEDRIIMVNCVKELHEFVEVESVKDCSAISSWYMDPKLCQFPFQLDAPKLEILLLNSRNPLDLSHSSFEGIKGIKVVAMINNQESFPLMIQLPQSIQWLSNIQTLRLQEWDLGDISFVVSLKRIEILDLRGCKFKKLPNGIDKLNKLKLLDLSKCRADECCCKLIGRCLRLEELYACRNFLHLGNTNCYECLVGISAFPKLRRYLLEMGDSQWSKSWNECTRVLCLGKLDIFTASAIIKDLAQKAVAIAFDELQGGCKTFIPDVVQAVGGMDELTKLHLRCCSEIECLIDKSTHEDFIVPKLVELELECMHNLKHLCHGPSLPSLFQNLESLEIYNCHQLQTMFPTDCNLGNLEFLKIFNCPLLTSLFPVSIACSLLSLQELRIEKCSKLKHVIEVEDGFDAWEDLRFPKWETLFVRYCYGLESICPMFCVQGFVQLKYLFIKDAPELKFVFGERAGEEPSIYDQNENQIVLPLLEDLTLQDLPNLLRIFSESYHPWWPSIKKVDWRNCPSLNTSCDSLIISSELRQSYPKMELHAPGDQLRNEESKSLAAVSNIESISLWKCGVLSIFHYQTGVEVPKATISNGLNLIPQIPIFQYLKNLSLNYCPKLKFVFCTSIYQSLPDLTSITISNCEELEEIFVGDEQTQKKLSGAHFCLPKLQSVSINQCNKLRKIFFAGICQRLPKLTSVTISNCEGLEEIFVANEQTHKKLSRAHSCLPKLQSLSISMCNKLRMIFSAGICQGLPELSQVYVWKCRKLEEVFAGNEETQKNLSIAQACLPKLQRLEIDQCYKLKFIFSVMTSAATSMLPQISTLSISNASQLEESFKSSNIEYYDIDSEKVIRFPSLKHIKLQKLPRLVNICQGFKLHLAEFCSVLIHECPKFLPIVGVSTEWTIEGLVRKYTVKCTQLNNNEAHSPSLSVLNSEVLDIGCSSVQDLFEVIGDGDDVQLMDSQVLRSEHQILKGLVPTQVLSFRFLHSLRVIKCKKLKFLFSTSAVVHKGLPKLTTLIIYYCEDLEEIITDNEEPQNISNAQVCFPKLRELDIRFCNNLKRLFSTTMATTLPQLNSLLIHEAGQLEVIFGHGGEDGANSGEKVVLPNLREIKFQNLPNFMNVCQGFQLQAVQLSQIVICGCPKFLDPILGSTQMISLQQWETMSPQISTEVSDFQTGVNIVEKQLTVNEENGMIMISRVESLGLWHSANLMTVWEYPTSIIFQNLRWFSVFGCRKLKSIFPCNVIRSLPCLKFLYIEECEELEEIMSGRQEQKHHFLNPSLNSLCFPQLSNLLVQRCSKLKCLFSSLLYNEDLPQLQYMKIKGCSQLERVFSTELKIHEEGLNKSILPKLKEFILEDCPNFSRTTLVSLQDQNADDHQECAEPSDAILFSPQFYSPSLASEFFIP